LSVERRVGRARPAWEVLAAAEAEQITHDGERVRVQKERVRVGGRLQLVRKWTRPGPKVVLVHGFAQNRYSWHTTMRSPSAWLAQRGFDVHVVDLPGHGDSRPAGGGTFADYVEEAVLLSDAIGEPAAWVGHSLGGAVSYALATRAPVRGVVGIGAVFRFAQANRVLHWLCRASHLAAGSPGATLGPVSVRTRLAGRFLAKVHAVSDLAGYGLPVSGWAPGSIEPELLAERLDRGFDWTTLQVWLDMARWGSTGRFDFEDAWARVDVPLLVVAGDLDHLAPPADARSAFDASGSRDRKFVLLDDWSTGYHWGHLDLVLGKRAPVHAWPLLADWLAAR
jgi:pimeloyl-ACP methyl ester carboxylesterase